MCVDGSTGSWQYAYTAGASCGAFQCSQYGWTTDASCTCTNNGENPVACLDQYGAANCWWRDPSYTNIAGVFGNYNLLVCQ